MEETTKHTVETKVHQDGGADLSLPETMSVQQLGSTAIQLTLLQLDSLLQSDIHSHKSHVWLAVLALQEGFMVTSFLPTHHSLGSQFAYMHAVFIHCCMRSRLNLCFE